MKKLEKYHYYIIETGDCVHVIPPEELLPRTKMGWKIACEVFDKDFWEIASIANDYAAQRMKTCLIARSPQEEQEWKILMEVFNLLAERGRRKRKQRESEKNLAPSPDNAE